MIELRGVWADAQLNETMVSHDMPNFNIHLCLVMLLVGGCTQAPEPLTEWLGPQLHGEIRGEIDDERVDVVASAGQLECKREYFVPDPNDPATWGEGRYDVIEVNFFVTIDGTPRHYELELLNHDFSEAAVGTALKVVPVIGEDEHAEIGADEVHVEVKWDWKTDGDSIAYEQFAISGTVELRELSGVVGPDGLVIPAGDGNFGAFLDIQLPDGELTASMTAPCTEVDVESIE